MPAFLRRPRRNESTGSIELHPVDNNTIDDKPWRCEPNASPRDSLDMQRMGRVQEFRRNFQTSAITAFSIVTMMGWVFIPINAPNVIQVAGTTGTICISLANFFGFLTIVLSLAEMASMAPTAGGQFQWVSEFAPPSIQKFLSYVSGWLSSLSWLTGVATAMFIAGNLIPNLIAMVQPEFESKAWQGYLFVLAICVICFCINGFLAKHLPLLEGFVFSFMMVAFVSIIIVLLTLSPLQSSDAVFHSWAHETSSEGIREVFAAQVLILFSFLGSDSTAHMAEETENAAKVIPRAMVLSYAINGILGFSMLLTVCFCWVAPDLYADPSAEYPFLDLFVTATGSKHGAIILASLMIILIVLSVTNFMASTSRQIFAFARDNGLPCSRWISKVNKRTLTPINSLVIVALFVVMICWIGFVSEVAFNAIVSLQVMAIAGTYMLSLVSLVWRRLCGQSLPERAWSLGRWGLPLNIIGAVYSLYLLIYAALPGVYPITAKNMNWAPVMCISIMLLSLLYYWGYARKIYSSPVTRVRS